MFLQSQSQLLRIPLVTWKFHFSDINTLVNCAHISIIHYILLELHLGIKFCVLHGGDYAPVVFQN